MNIPETSQFLKRVALLDNRQVDEATIAHWQSILDRYELGECIRALEKHMRDTTDYLMPAHIVRLVRADHERIEKHLPIPGAERHGAPKPDNFDAMCAAWNDPVAFAREVYVYDEQLIAAGFEPTRGRFSDRVD